MSRSTVVIDLAADAQVSRDLAAGGVFVPGCALRLAEECDLLVCGANHRLVLPARVVYVDAVRGAGLELVGFSTEMKAQIAELEPICAPAGLDDEPVLEEATEDAIDDAIEDAALAAAFPDDDDDDDDRRGYTEPVPLVVLEALDDDLTVPVFSDRAGDRHTPARDDGDHPREGADTDAYPQLRDGTVESHGDGDHDSGALDTDAYPQLADTPDDEIARIGDASLPTEAYPALPGDAAGELYEIAAGPDSALRAAHDADKPFPRNVHERLRGLTLVAQHKLAVSGELHERIVLERLYGKNVWETLLRNPRLTAPEVSRIARYGSLPRVLLEIIVGNNVWLQVPEVRRALLSNPRLGTDQIMKVLRLTPKHELKLAAIQTAYPIAVRHAAKLLLRGD